MRVLRVLYELRPSGVEANLRATAPDWRAHGIDIDILATGPEFGPYAPILAEAGYRVRHLPQEPVARFVREYIAMLRRERYDLVHVQTEQGNIATVGLARLTGTRVVRSAHNVFNFQGALRVERTIQRALLRAMGVTHVAVSTSVAKSEWRNFRNPTVRIFNGFDDRRFHPPTSAARAAARSAVHVADDEFLIVTVGNCSPDKNHGVVLEALPLLQATRPVRYLHVGAEEPGSPERDLARRLGIADAVEFLGQRGDVDRLLHAADCYVMPSLREGLSNAALEGLACGLPAVLSDVPGMRDLRDVVPGITWTAPEPQALAKALDELNGTDPAVRAQLGARSAAATREHFAMAHHVSRYVELYSGKLERPA
jgi:glycosyltransferase involved in cell wall biosynthesis